MSLKQEIERLQQESMKQIPEDTLKTLIATGAVLTIDLSVCLNYDRNHDQK